MNKKLLKAIYPELAGVINGEESNELMQDLLLEMKKDRSLKMDGIQAITYKGDKGDDGYTPIKDVDYRDGIDGENYYHLTEQDKQSIIQSIEVPIVDKIIEKTEVIRELPIVTNQIVEKAVPDTADEIANKLNTLEEKIEPKVIIGLEDKFNKFAESFKKGGKNQLKLNDVAGAPLDQRWHGGGLSKVSHDATLSGSGTPSDPLVVTGSGSSIALKTNGVANGSQSILNLKQGTNVTIADDGVGGVTINSTASGSGTVTSVTSATADATVATTTTTPVITIVSAPKLTTARTISGTSFDGTANITLNNTGITNGAGYITGISGLDHNILSNLTTGDVHTQYALLAGRSTPQQFTFGTAASASTGYLTSTSNATKGKYFLNAAGTIAVDELNVRMGINVASPTEKLDINGNINLSATSSTVGQIKIGTNIRYHFYGADNQFFGGSTGPSGNFTLTGVSNTAFGRYSAFLLSSGSGNFFAGDSSGAYCTTGSNNVGIGPNSMLNAGSTSNSFGLGLNSLASVTAGVNLVAIGVSTLQLTTGSYNTAIGGVAGYTNTTGTYNTYIGVEADCVAGTYNYSMALGAKAKVGASNTVAIGGADGGGADVNVIIGGTTASARLHIISTTLQKRLAYNASNYFDTTVNSTGSTTFALTGTSPIFTFSQEVRNTVAGTNSASTVTVGGTQTLTGKTLTSPVINTPTGIVKGDVGLGNVDNTSDVNKPVSTATQTALDLKANLRVITSITGTTTALAVARTDYVYIASSGTFVFTLPTAVSNTNRYALKNNGSGTLTMGSTSGQTIDNLTASTFTLLPGDSLEFISDNTNFITLTL